METIDEKYFDIVFNGPPSRTAGRFVEVEDESGASVRIGKWIKRADGYWCLRIPNDARAMAVEKRPQELVRAWKCDECGECFADEPFEHARAAHHPRCDGSCAIGCPVMHRCGPVRFQHDRFVVVSRDKLEQDARDLNDAREIIKMLIARDVFTGEHGSAVEERKIAEAFLDRMGGR